MVGDTATVGLDGAMLAGKAPGAPVRTRQTSIDTRLTRGAPSDDVEAAQGPQALRDPSSVLQPGQNVGALGRLHHSSAGRRCHGFPCDLPPVLAMREAYSAKRLHTATAFGSRRHEMRGSDGVDVIRCCRARRGTRGQR
jgi:hypothetical protein